MFLRPYKLLSAGEGYLDVACLVVLQEIPDKETLVLALHIHVMTLS